MPPAGCRPRRRPGPGSTTKPGPCWPLGTQPWWVEFSPRSARPSSSCGCPITACGCATRRRTVIWTVYRGTCGWWIKPDRSLRTGMTVKNRTEMRTDGGRDRTSGCLPGNCCEYGSLIDSCGQRRERLGCAWIRLGVVSEVRSTAMTSGFFAAACHRAFSAPKMSLRSQATSSTRCQESELPGHPGRLPAQGSHGSGRAELPHPARPVNHSHAPAGRCDPPLATASTAPRRPCVDRGSGLDGPALFPCDGRLTRKPPSLHRLRAGRPVRRLPWYYGALRLLPARRPKLIGFAQGLPPFASDDFAPFAARWQPQGPGPCGSADPRSRDGRRGQAGLPGSWEPRGGRAGF
jgi:hypothetical protein